MKLTMTNDEYMKCCSGAVSKTVDGKTELVSPLELPLDELIAFLGCEEVPVEVESD